jgi:GT2 family glycosyltransferase
MRGEMVLSIIIVNWNVKALLRDCLNSIYQTIEMPGDQFEIIVVDNDSNDGSVAMVAECFPQVKVIANQSNVGFGLANNQAEKICRGKYILLLNPDTLIVDRAVDAMVEHLDACKNAAAIGCRLVNADGSLQRWTGGAFPTLWNVACHYLFLDRLLPRRLRPQSLYLDMDVKHDVNVDWVSGACVILRKEMLGSYLFDETYFMYGEDMELCHRLKKAGYEVLYSPVASVTHFQGASMAQQKGDVLLSSIKGPRQFFQLSDNSSSKLFFFDLFTLAGFFLRGIVYGGIGLLGLNDTYRDRARSSWNYMVLALKVMRSK